MAAYAADDANMLKEDPPYPTYRGTRHGEIHGDFIWMPKARYDYHAGQWTPTGVYTWHFAPPSGTVVAVATLAVGSYYIPSVMGSKINDDTALAVMKEKFVEKNLCYQSNWTLLYLIIAYTALVIIITCYCIWKCVHACKTTEKRLRDVQVQSPTTYTSLRGEAKPIFFYFQNWDWGLLKDHKNITGNTVTWHSNTYTLAEKTKRRRD